MSPVDVIRKAHETGVLYEHGGCDREMRNAWEESTGFRPEATYYAIPEDVLMGMLKALEGLEEDGQYICENENGCTLRVIRVSAALFNETADSQCPVDDKRTGAFTGVQQGYLRGQ